MKILLLCEGDAETWDSWSGISRSIVDHFRAAGDEVICGDVDLRGFDRLAVAAVTVSPERRRWWVRYHLGGVPFRARSRRGARLLRENAGRFDAVLQFGATFQVTPPRGVPHVLYCDSNIEMARQGSASNQSEGSSLTPSEIEDIRGREAKVYGGADRIFTMSERLRSTFIQDFGIPGERVTTVGGGPNFRRGAFPDVPPRPPAARRNVLFIGRAFERKGGDVLLAAFERVRSVLPDATLTVIGPDRDGRDLGEGVEWIGFLNKDTPEGMAALQKAYAEAAVFCLPTRFEPFGIVFLEAMYYRLPCVGPAHWAVPEIIADGETGLTYEPENVEQLADRLVRVLEDPELGRRMGEAGRERMETIFTWSAVVDRMRGALADAAAAKRS